MKYLSLSAVKNDFGVLCKVSEPIDAAIIRLMKISSLVPAAFIVEIDNKILLICLMLHIVLYIFLVMK